MANVDRPNGFRPVKTISGAPINSTLRFVGVADGTDIFVGDALELSSGLATPFTVADECLGVAAGFGKISKGEQNYSGPYNPDTLMTRYYDDSASTHTEWGVWYYPVDDMIFEAQTGTAATLTVGEPEDITVTAGSTTTGISTMEIDAGTLTGDGDVVVVEIPNLPDNDNTLVWGRYWVKFTTHEFAPVP